MIGEYVQQWTACHAVQGAGLEPSEVWLTYLGMGGSRDEAEVGAYLAGLSMLPLVHRDLVADAINELIEDGVLEDSGLPVDGAHYSTQGVADGSGFAEYLRPLTLSPDGYRFDRPAGTAARGISDTGDAVIGAEELLDEAEFRRCHALNATGLLDTGTDERFDALVGRTRERFGTSSASFAVITEDRQVIKSVVGPIGQDLPREMALCARTIEADRTLVIRDAINDPAWVGHPLVTGGPRIRFYAGHPLHSVDGARIGSLCIIDAQPRSFTEDDQEDLRLLAVKVQLEIWLRAA